jgi:hypothetical protein
MISEIRGHTSNTKENINCISDFPLSNKSFSVKNFDKTLDERASFRLFSKSVHRISYANLISIGNYLSLLIEENFPAIKTDVSINIIDNDSIIDTTTNTQSSIYVFQDNEFKKQATYLPINGDTLYLQEEMHNSSVVFFFVWNIKSLSKKYESRFYREITMISGFLGHQVSLKAVTEGFRGTMFSGISPVEFTTILQKDGSSFLPIFAYAME